MKGGHPSQIYDLIKALEEKTAGSFSTNDKNLFYFGGFSEPQIT